MNGLEHFYYGQLIHDGAPKDNYRVLARSKGITEQQVKFITETIKISPVNSNSPINWGIVRGNKTIPYILAQAQYATSDSLLHHYVLVPSELTRLLSGNIKAYLPIIPQKLPSFAMLGDELPLLGLPNPVPQPEDQQADDLLELLNYVQNNTKNIEPLLGAIIEGRTLQVIKAPEDVEQRANFVQGLTTLLPASTRYGVTFLLQSGSDSNAQIIFSNDPAVEDTVVFDWGTGKVDNPQPNEYARFIVSQLRLDASLAVQQAEALTQTAGWRFKSGERLSEALAYASHRSKIDQAVQNRLPVATLDVSHILANDPTLDDAKRERYAQHLVDFALALNDNTHTEPVAIVCGKSAEMANQVLKQFNRAMAEGKASFVFQTLAKWLENPLAPQSQDWIDLLNKSALLELRDIVQNRDTESLKLYLNDIQHLQGTTLVDRIVPKVLEVSLSLVSEDAELPSQVMLLGMSFLDKSGFQKLLTSPNLAKYLPREIKQFLRELYDKEFNTISDSILQAAGTMNEEQRNDAIMRFVEMAYESKRLNLLSDGVLKVVIRITTGVRSEKYQPIVLNIARDLLEGATPAPRGERAKYFLQLLLISRRYDLLNRGMQEQSRLHYAEEKQADYFRLLQDVFASTRLPAQDMSRAINDLQGYGLKNLGFISAVAGALQAINYTSELEEFADFVLNMLVDDRSYSENIHHEAPLALLKYYIAQRNSRNVQQLARLIPTVSTQKSDRESLIIIRDSYNAIAEHERLGRLGMDMLRQFIRLASPKVGQRIIEYYAKEFDKDQTQKVNRSLDFAILLSYLPIHEYADAARLTADMLEKAHQSYLNSKIPTTQIDALYDGIRPKVDVNQRKKIAEELNKFIKLIVTLGKLGDSRSTNSETIGQLVRGQDNPRNVLEVLRFSGGFFLRGRVYSVKPKPIANPFIDINPQNLFNNLVLSNLVLSAVVKLAQTKRNWSNNALTDELESLLRMLTSDPSQELYKLLGIDLQRIAELLPMLVKDADSTISDEQSKLSKKLESKGQQPKNALEFYRYMIGSMR
jgi:hypothetical protein